MAWDLEIGPLGDMTGGIVGGADEIIQRVRTRLGRFLGEWFLDQEAGLPWLESILGGSNRSNATLLIRREILDTEGVTRIVRFEPLWSNRTRELSLYFELVLTDGTVRTMTYSASEA